MEHTDTAYTTKLLAHKSILMMWRD